MSDVEEMTDDEAETAALDMGWTSKDEFKGNPDNHIEAREYVRRGENYMPFAKKQIRELKATVDTLTDSVVASEVRHDAEIQKTRQSAHDSARLEITKEMAQAVEDGDGDKVMKSQEQISDLDEKHYAAPAATSTVAAQFKSNHSGWFNDRGTYAEMEQIGRWLNSGQNEYRVSNEAEYISAMESEMEKYIEKTKPRETIHSMDSGGAPSSLGKTTATTFNSLPPSAKETFETILCKGGGFKNDDAGRKKYAALYYRKPGDS